MANRFMKLTSGYLKLFILCSFIFITGYVFLFIVLGHYVFLKNDILHKSDQQMIQDFLKNENKFYNLLNMVSHDEGLNRVDDNWYDPENLDSINISKERIELYRQLFKELGIPRGFYRYSNGDVEFISSSQGVAVSGSSKSFIWHQKKPSHLVESIDLDEKYINYPVYRHIKDHWYIMFDAD